MKTIKMQEHRLDGMQGWKETGTREFTRVSRWIQVKHNCNPCKRNSLWDFVSDGNGYKPYQDSFNPENGLYLDYFVWDGKTYAIEQFYSLGNPFWVPYTFSYTDENGKTAFLSGVDMYGDLYHPIYVEFDEYCENVRVYIEGR